MEMETIANLFVKENHGFTHDFPVVDNHGKSRQCV